MEQTLPIPFPARGLDENFAFSTQPPLTTREAENVRGIDPRSGRTRGGQRSGLSAAFDDASVSGLNQVKDLSFITYNKKVIEYAEGTPLTFSTTDPEEQSGTPPVEWSLDSPDALTSSTFVRDAAGNFYFALDTNSAMISWAKYSSSGGLVYSADPGMPGSDALSSATSIYVDEFENVFTTQSSGAGLGVLQQWIKNPDGDSYTLGYTANLALQPFVEYVAGILLDGDNLITLEWETVPDDLDVPEEVAQGTSGGWVESTLRLSQTGQFASYTFREGDVLIASGGTPAVSATPVEVESRISDDEIELRATIGADSTGVTWRVERRPKAFVRTYPGVTDTIGPEGVSPATEIEVPPFPQAIDMDSTGGIYVALSSGHSTPASGDFYGDLRIDLHKYTDAYGTVSFQPEWTVNNYVLSGLGYTATHGGVGSGVRVGPGDELYSVGGHPLNTGAPVFSGTITATATELQCLHRVDPSTGALTWSEYINRYPESAASFPYAPGFSYPMTAGIAGPASLAQGLFRISIDVDADGNVYVPTNIATEAHNSTPINFRKDKVRIYTNDGALKYGIEGEADGQVSRAVAVPKANPAYLSDPVDLAEFVYVHQAPDGAEAEPKEFVAYRLVDVSYGDLGQPRGSRVVGVANGNIRVLDDTGSNIIDSGGANTGEGVLAANAPTIFATEHFGSLYYTDGLTYAIYDPRSTTDGGLTAYGGVTTWTSNAGTIPPRCRLIETWRGRVVLSGDPEDPQNWYMSAVSDATNWNFSPSVPTAGDAISGNTTRAGLSPDLVNAMVPYNDDLLVLGGDHQLWVLRGDPLNGGAFDLISDATGMAWGRPWCKDPAGRLYFFGSRGGVYVMAGATPVPQRISRDRIERQLQDEVDLNANYVRLYWNYRDEGLHVFQYPYGAVGSTPLKSWFWDSKNDAWWVDTFDVSDDEDGNSGYLYQPTAGLVADGDLPNDRKLYLGLGTGAVRMWDEAALSDAGRRIDSFVTIGPMTPADGTREFRFNQFQANLASDQSGCTAELISSDETDRLEDPRHRFDLAPGRNPFMRRPMRGSAAWLRLRNGALNERWALESASIRASVMGRARRRAC